ncbi:hypothetical protein CPB83DRAFT_846504 [Crepidotus variabilis]|uniref:Uncharacterized protein n=1 Tax=Crepidotus variabilis TaxID=179855 RepID=A0A9P6EN73_9AGAR|nr:hypothetical protein CPB83DRAFT_846504 [Crepidotus variabilis]
MRKRPILATYPYHITLFLRPRNSNWVHEDGTFLAIVGLLENSSSLALLDQDYNGQSTFNDNSAFLEKFWKPFI